MFILYVAFSAPSKKWQILIFELKKISPSWIKKVTSRAKPSWKSFSSSYGSSQLGSGSSLLLSLQGNPVLIAGSLFWLQGFPCISLYFPVRDCSTCQKHLVDRRTWQNLIDITHYCRSWLNQIWHRLFPNCVESCNSLEGKNRVQKID